MPIADNFPKVAGRCPNCELASLFVGNGGHVTCSSLACSDPTAADRLMHGEGVALTLEETKGLRMALRWGVPDPEPEEIESARHKLEHSQERMEAARAL